MPTDVKYLVDQRVSTVWNRITNSKVTYVVVLYVLAKAMPMFETGAWLTLAAWQSFMPTVFGGSVVILMRSAIKKAELASNAANQNTLGVRAVEVQKKSGPSGGITAGLIGLLALVGVSLGGCSALSSLTDPSGNPIATPGPVCHQTENGRVCYMPDPVPGTAAIAPPPPLTVIPALEK